MVLGKVVGTVVSTRKEEALTGLKLLIVRELDTELKAKSSFVVAVDAVGAGRGEVVLYASGSSARLTDVTRDKPVDAVIMGIVDTLEIEGKELYQKRKSR
ncbi:MAG: EutN/CcmL family microcompartment protein [Candidatus Eiseniibacteriota bacterium]|nr:MAG: EutN/CcmL family microcompartment protein [Candidatus Eisenbacteria bacterium]